ncbi:MAG TPA: NYN domain-containing protein [Gemmatimonadales bacterium]|nr:NYN domain-containing protein [Gemmatimonadales bacterium]
MVDGFNLYHSIIEASEVQPAASMKWLDLLALCRSYLSAIGRDATLERIFYFSALPEWRPDKMARQAIYVAALKTTGVEVQLGRFKEKEVMCFSCGATFKRHEEKETDVAVAVKLMELFLLNACDTVVLVTGDTDLAPAIRTAKVRWPEKKVWALFPFGRHNAELKAIAHGHIKIKANAYLKSQLPNPIKISDGELLWKPTGW